MTAVRVRVCAVPQQSMLRINKQTSLRNAANAYLFMYMNFSNYQVFPENEAVFN